MNGPFPLRGRVLAATLASVLGLGAVASAQTAPLPTYRADQQIDTGLVANTGRELEAVAAVHVSEPGAAWMRLYFSDVQLSGSLEAGTGSFLRITSLRDGYHQLLDTRTISEWGYSSAYFNGDLLLVELLAYPNTGTSRVVIDAADLGLLPPDGSEEDTICGPEDNRVPSSDPRAARLLPVGCTGFLIDDACGCMLTAGHCVGSTNVVQFNVPLSNSNGSLNNPPPSDQYSVDQSSKQGVNGGVGNDWGYYGVFPNSTTGLLPKQAQGSTYLFRLPPTWNTGDDVRITGYGVDSGTSNQIQQTHVGPWQQYTGGASLTYRADTQGGNSGSPVIQEQAGVAMGIHTHGGCTSSGGANQGTAGGNSGLQQALANPKGVCLKTTCTLPGTVTVRNGSGVNPLCLSSNDPIIGTTWEIQVDGTGVPGAGFSIVRCQSASSGQFVSFGELLINLASPICFQSIVGGGGVTTHEIVIPLNSEFIGFASSVQGVVGGGDGDMLVQACNALDFVVGCE